MDQEEVVKWLQDNRGKKRARDETVSGNGDEADTVNKKAQTTFQHIEDLEPGFYDFLVPPQGSCHCKELNKIYGNSYTSN